MQESKHQQLGYIHYLQPWTNLVSNWIAFGKILLQSIKQPLLLGMVLSVEAYSLLLSMSIAHMHTLSLTPGKVK